MCNRLDSNQYLAVVVFKRILAALPLSYYCIIRSTLQGFSVPPTFSQLSFVRINLISYPYTKDHNPHYSVPSNGADYLSRSRTVNNSKKSTKEGMSFYHQVAIPLDQVFLLYLYYIIVCINRKQIFMACLPTYLLKQISYS